MAHKLSPRVQARLDAYRSAVDLATIQHREYVDSLPERDTDEYGWPVDTSDVWQLPPAPLAVASDFDPELDDVYSEARWGNVGRWHAARGRYNRQVPRDQLI